MIDKYLNSFVYTFVRFIYVGTIECLIRTLQLLEEEESYGKFELKYSSLDIFMRLDSAASEAVNLLPKPDHPSQYGSIFGTLSVVFLTA